ncbi:MAG: 3-phosphoshikimate 1-carboxyvinyltransferase [Bacteroidetes bacterium]|nr:3-phosphoshikimate 1-carboxyvinyltransferase [Bacteroidota bacterium]
MEVLLLKKKIVLNDKMINIGGSKSLSNRWLILQQTFPNLRLENLSTAEDTVLLQKALLQNATVVDVHHAGTAMRFLCSFFSIQNGKTVILTGSERLKQRPIHDLVLALRSLGAEIEYLEKEGFPPLKIKGKKIENNRVSIQAGISSQFITSLLLMGAQLDQGLTIQLEGKLTSRPYLEMSISILKELGINVHWAENLIQTAPTKEFTMAKTIKIESDWSSASYFYAIVALGKVPLSLSYFAEKSLQGDSILAEIFNTYFGITTEFNQKDLSIRLLPNPEFRAPKNIYLNLNQSPDIAQTLCVVATALQIPFHFDGLHTLKIKETDRLLALQNELAKLGCKTEITEHSIRSLCFDKTNRPIRIATYQDHRMAMSFAPFCFIQDIEIEEPEVVSKSYPDFWKDFESISQNFST